VGGTPKYKLASTFERELHSFLIEKSNIRVVKLPQFRIGLTLVRAHLPHPKKPSITIQEACTAFELQVLIHLQKVMENILSRVFDHPETNPLKFVYYKQHHVNPSAFVKAVQIQRKHEQSHRVIAFEGLHPNQHFDFEHTLPQQFPQIIAVLPTSKSRRSIITGSPIGRYNLLCLTKRFVSLAVSCNFPNL
jgi:hypothetical protein